MFPPTSPPIQGRACIFFCELKEHCRYSDWVRTGSGCFCFPVFGHPVSSAWRPPVLTTTAFHCLDFIPSVDYDVGCACIPGEQARPASMTAPQCRLPFLAIPFLVKESSVGWVVAIKCCGI